LWSTSPGWRGWRRNNRGGKVRVTGPLLGGYMFVGVRSRLTDKHGHDNDVCAISAVEGVHAIVRFSALRAPLPVPFSGEDGVASILAQELAGAFDKTVARKRRPDPVAGDSVTVVRGMFKGFPARFVERGEGERVRVLLHMFGRWTPTPLSSEQVAEFAEDE
jgi:transcription antitermination factor NusG